MNQLRIFNHGNFSSSPGAFLNDLLSFNEYGRQTAETEVDEIRYFVNAFWTSRQRKSHSLHEISYRACFKAQLPEFFIKRLTQIGDAVYDPFMGRGTTPIQAALMGRRAFGKDVNPLSTLLARPRLRSISTAEVQSSLASVDWTNGEIQREDLLAFYHPEVLQRLEALKTWFGELAPIDADDVDPVVDWIRMVAINRLSGHSPGFFSGRSMPPNQAVSVKSQIRINEKLGVEPPIRDIPKIILKKTKSLLRDGCVSRETPFGFRTGEAWNSPTLDDGSMDLVVTSPPFLDIVQYAKDNWLRCWFAGIDPELVNIAMHRTEDAWISMVRDVLREQARIVRPGGYVALEVGEVRNRKVLLERLVWKAAEGLPFDRLGVMVNDQEFTKTANCWGVANGKKGTNTNRVVLLHRR